MKKILLVLIAILFLAPTITYKVKFLDKDKKVLLTKVIRAEYDGSKITMIYLSNLAEEFLGTKITTKKNQTTDIELANGIIVLKPIPVWADTVRYMKIGKNINIKR